MRIFLASILLASCVSSSKTQNAETLEMMYIQCQNDCAEEGKLGGIQVFEGYVRCVCVNQRA